MTNPPYPNPLDASADVPSNTDPQLQDLVSEWQYARIRLANLRSNPNLWREMYCVIALLALVFGWPAITWLRRWTLSPAIQSYAILIGPAVLYWIWIARRRLVVPEIDPIRDGIRLKRQTRIKPKEIGEREKTVLSVLTEEPPVLDVRSGALLYCSLGLDIVAFWLGDPTLSCLGFILTCAGIVLFRHGKIAFKTALFPFLFIFAMIPIPGPVRDAIVDRAQPAILGMIEHMVNNVKIIAALPIEGNPLNITAPGGTHAYAIYAERAGLCIPESIAVILCAIFYLSLIRTPNPLPKIGVVVSTVIACFVVMVARLLLICLVAVYDTDIAALLEVLTRFLLVGVELGLLFLFVRGFKCVKFHRWVSLSLRF